MSKIQRYDIDGHVVDSGGFWYKVEDVEFTHHSLLKGLRQFIVDMPFAKEWVEEIDELLDKEKK